MDDRTKDVGVLDIRPIRSFKTNSVNGFGVDSQGQATFWGNRLSPDEIITLDRVEQVVAHEESSDNIRLSHDYVYVWDVIHVPTRTSEEIKEIVEGSTGSLTETYVPVEPLSDAGTIRSLNLIACYSIIKDFDLAEAIIDHVGQMERDHVGKTYNDGIHFNWNWHNKELWIEWVTYTSTDDGHGHSRSWNNKMIFSFADYRTISGTIKELMGEIDMRRVVCELISAHFKKAIEGTR